MPRGNAALRRAGTAPLPTCSPCSTLRLRLHCGPGNLPRLRGAKSGIRPGKTFYPRLPRGKRPCGQSHFGGRGGESPPPRERAVGSADRGVPRPCPLCPAPRRCAAPGQDGADSRRPPARHPATCSRAGSPALLSPSPELAPGARVSPPGDAGASRLPRERPGPGQGQRVPQGESARAEGAVAAPREAGPAHSPGWCR